MAGINDEIAPDQDLVDPIAIVGTAIRFPGEAVTPQSFWQMLIEKRCAATKFPDDRINIDAFFGRDPGKLNQIVTREAHFLEGDFRAFDAQFFNVSPVEASAMHPQQRWLLENTYHALENAGISMADLAGTNTSVHVGCFTPDLTITHWRDAESIPRYSAAGSSAAMLSNKLSWFYNLHGASMTIDTACSSSMVALDLACNELWSGRSKIGIVTGANLILSPELNIVLSSNNMLSKDGRCYSFDHRANGYSRGEGVATLILKPLSHALKDGDCIRALIRSVGTNQDGYTKGGITQPSKEMQVRLIRDTYKKAGLNMAFTRFFEAHGTGTAIGDPIEARAIGECFRSSRSAEDPMYVGAVKSNIGHLEGVSGLASIIKVILMLEKGVIPPQCNFEVLNPSIDAEFLRLKFPTESVPWPDNGIRRASINSFGFGGTNAHVILDDARSYLQQRKLIGKHSTMELLDMNHTMANPTNGSLVESAVESSIPVVISPQLLTLSAANTRSLDQLVKLYSDYLATNSDQVISKMLADLAYTLNSYRSRLEYKSYAVVSSAKSIKDLPQLFSKPLRTKPQPQCLGFVFTGQGAQWPAMGKELLVYSIFKQSIERANTSLGGMGCDWSLLEELTNDPSISDINRPDRSQAICTAIQLAIVDLLKSVGVKPSTVVGHSSGEIAAAYAAGHISHESALKIAYQRGVVAVSLRDNSCQKWTMAAIGLSYNKVSIQLLEAKQRVKPPFEASQISISCINSPNNVTVSGPVAIIDLFLEYLSAKDIFARKLMVEVGYHSSQMQSIACEYRTRLGSLERGFQTNEAQMISTITGLHVSAETTCNREYWVQNMLSPVNFLDAMRKANKRKTDEIIVKRLDRSHVQETLVHGWVEIGPHSALKGYIRETINSLDRSSEVTYASVLVRNRNAIVTFLEAAGHLYRQSFSIDLQQLGLGRSDCQPGKLTDLPQYPFDYPVIHWQEAPKGRDYRLRRYAPHPLLGSPSVEWNELEPRWNFTIRSTELAWVQHHKVDGVLLYPAAGMLVMAVEAVKLLAENREPVGFEIQQAVFSSPLILSTSEPVEAQVSLRRSEVSAGASTYDFKLYARKNNDGWDDICHCSISACYTGIHSDANNDNEDPIRMSEIKRLHNKAESSCQEKIDTAKLYKMLRTDFGLDYGPPFQALRNIWHNNDSQALATVIPFTWTSDDGTEVQSLECQVVHPTTLDSLFHLAFVALGFRSKSSTTMVPTKIGRMWISPKGVGNSMTCDIQAVMHSKMTSKTSCSSTLSVISTTDWESRIEMDDLELTAVPSSHENNDSSVVKQICFELDYALDLDLVDRSEVSHFCEQARNSEAEPFEFLQKMELYVLSFAEQAVKRLQNTNSVPTSSQQSYFREMKRLLDHDLALLDHSKKEERQKMRLDPVLLDSLTEELSATKSGELIAKVGRALPEILVGTMDPLQLFFDDSQLLTDFYEEQNLLSSMFVVAGRWLNALVHKSPDMKFLEIGAGTGATTAPMLEILKHQSDIPRYSEYEFTDISPSFLPRARTRFDNYPNVRYRVLDIEADLEAQGYDSDGYDVIIAANALHATKDLGKTLQNTRKLLKSGGKLILVEATSRDVIRLPFIFGLLPGWWLSEDSRAEVGQGPCITESEWNVQLCRNGFSGTDLIFRDFQNPACHLLSVMITTAVKPVISAPRHMVDRKDVPHLESSTCHTPLPIATNHSCPNPGDFARTVLVYNKSSLHQQALAQELEKTLALDGGSLDHIELCELNAIPQPRDSHYIVLHELEEPIMSHLEPSSFRAIQILLSSSRSVIWVSKGGGCSPSNADHGTIKGLFRVFQFENSQTKLVTLVLEEGAHQPGCCDKIVNVFWQTSKQSQPHTCESEYVEINGNLHIPRLVKQSRLNQHIFERTKRPVYHREFGSQTPRKLQFKTPGVLDTMEFDEDDSTYQPLEADEIEVEVHAIGVNTKDCLAALGVIKGEDIGAECAGVIRRIGSLDLPFQAGDRVFLLGSNTFKRFVRSKYTLAAKVPDSLTTLEAGNFLLPSLTAYLGIVQVARMQQGESILIHSATSGVGQAAIQLASSLKIAVFATVSSAEKKQILLSQYSIPEDHVLLTEDPTLAQRVRVMTNGRGADVVLNSILGDDFGTSEECLSPFGKFIGIGRQHSDSRPNLPHCRVKANASFAEVDLWQIVQQQLPLDNSTIEGVLSLAEQGILRPAYPLNVYPLADLQHVFRDLHSGECSGNTVINFDAQSIVPVVSASRSNYVLDESATYVVAGGLGGLGQSLARWLVQRGAKNLLLLSRTGPSKNEKARKLISELTAMKVRVECPVCDITDLETLQATFDHAATSMPPIKGAVQASMVLKDATFAKMSYDDWRTCTQPKIQGSWNLHHTLPPGMDFFILLSSVSGILGNGGQANYAAGNTYQDSLAQYRWTLGEKATAIDLGVILEEGFVAENAQIMDHFIRQGVFVPLSQVDFFAIFDYLCDPVRGIDDHLPTQVVVGLELPANSLANGKELVSQLCRPMFRHMHQIPANVRTDRKKQAEQGLDYQSAFLSAADHHEAGSIVAEALRAKISLITGLSIEDIPLDSRMDALGIDSLVAIELRNWFAREWKADVAVFEILGATSPLSTGAMIAKKSSFKSKKWTDS